jgi:N-acetylglucosamine-6-phosphate deacetylase
LVAQRTKAADDGVRLADGTLAGSTLALDEAVGNLVAYAGVPLSAAVVAATAAPAAVLGMTDRGTLAVGAVGDVVLLDDAGALAATVIGGRVAHRREAAWRS